MDDAAVLLQAASFEALLSSLTSVDNAARGGAEACYERCKAQPEALVAALLRCVRTSGAQEHRVLAAVLLRKARAARAAAAGGTLVRTYRAFPAAAAATQLLAKHDASAWPKLSGATQARRAGRACTACAARG